MGRPCCAAFACREPLQNNRHRYCKTHFNQHDICAVVLCEEPITGYGSKTCANLEHKEFERKNKEKGASNFILKERFWHTQVSQPVDTLNTQQIDHIDDVEETTIEWFEVDDSTNTVRLKSRANPGTVGTDDDGAVPPLDPCPSKSASGNRVVKAQFSRRRTHNEQTLVCPCGIIYARATMFGAEAVSNFLVCHRLIKCTLESHCSSRLWSRMPFPYQAQKSLNIFSTTPTVLHVNKLRRAFLGSKELGCVSTSGTF